jgi:hypothetical protein
MTVLKDSFRAWIDNQPPGPKKLIVKGQIEVPTGGWTSSLNRVMPQGISPNVLILELKTVAPSGNVIQIVSTIDARYEEAPPSNSLY